MFKKILVCLDGSEIAERIIPFVKEEALTMESKVILLQAVNFPGLLTLGIPGFPAVPVYTPQMPEQVKREYDAAKIYLERVAQPIREKGIKVEVETLIGLPGPTIISYANEKKIDLIAMVTHGHSGLRNVLLGSVAEYIVKESGLPIMMIRAN